MVSITTINDPIETSIHSKFYKTGRFSNPDPYMYGGYPHHDNYGHGPSFDRHPPPGVPREDSRPPPQTSDIQTQPVMLTLKQFLATQDDSISDSDAIAKYNDYKIEFRRQQLNEFFVAHKDEEW